MLKNESEVKEYLLEYKNPVIVIASTIRDGYVSCIKPVSGLFGAELHVNSKTKPNLEQLLRGKV